MGTADSVGQPARRCGAEDDMDHMNRGEAFIRDLAAAVRSASIYGIHHPTAQRRVATLSAIVDARFQTTPQLTIGFLGDDVLVERTRLRSSANLQGLVRQFRDLRVEKLTLTRALRPEDLHRLVALIGERSDRPLADRLADSGIRGVGLGLIEHEAPGAHDKGIAAARHVYAAAVAAAATVWDSAVASEAPDPESARAIIDTLADAVTHNRASMLALTSIKTHDPYTFTHMVNVALLTMMQARSLGLSPAFVREFGLAGLMHDVGKVKVPSEILTKPADLTAEERTIMQRHVVDGAQILRKTPGMPALAPIVAFEHHLRQDLSGYPTNIGSRKLNLCTMVVSISDVFDALRSNRSYRAGLATDRVRFMLDEQSGRAFEPTLLRRFTSLVGLFPAGTVVHLASGQIGVVAEANAADIYRPRVRVVRDATGTPLAAPRWVDTAARGVTGAFVDDIVEAIDPVTAGIDPLRVLEP